MMTSKTAATTDRKPEDATLDRRYGKIGILAVAAALAYQSDSKNTAYAPTEPRADDRYAEMAAA
jgi:hypothetical protein